MAEGIRDQAQPFHGRAGQARDSTRYVSPFSFMLDSSYFHPSYANKNIYSASPYCLLIAYANKVYIIDEKGHLEVTEGNTLTTIHQILDTKLFRQENHIAIGYLSYDFKDVLHNNQDESTEEISLPVALLGFYNEYKETDARTGNLILSKEVINQCASTAVEILDRNIKINLSYPEQSISQKEYLDKIHYIKSEISNGNVYEVNLSNRFIMEAPEPGLEYYDYMREKYPSFYGAFLNCGPFTILSNSPEEYLYRKGDYIRTRPIKGTIKRDDNPDQDEINRQSLINSEKNFAELAMIIDLERNDLHRICKTGTVQVENEKRIETHPTVHHLSSTISGTIRQDITFMDILSSCFPGGSITGAPKTAAIKYIGQLEPTKRGVYTGAIGYIKSNGDFMFNMAIRTAIHIDSLMYFNSGGAITIDSDAEEEYEEIMVKATAYIRTIREVNNNRNVYNRESFKT